ncbi:MAG: transglutaminase domain-containing protein [Spirochaetota bacterium]
MDWQNKIKEALSKREELIELKVPKVNDHFIQKLQDYLQIAAFHSGYFGYLVQNSKTQYSSNGDIKIKINYQESKEESISVVQFANTFMQNRLAKISNEWEKLLLIHDFLRDKISYDASHSHKTPFLALKTGKSVCLGFALLFGLLLKQAGIKQCYVSGVARDPHTRTKDNHIWNKVMIGGLVYTIDLTWDSCTKATNPYSYFCVMDKQVIISHFTEPNLPPIPKSSDIPFYQLIAAGKLPKIYNRLYPYVSPGKLLKYPEDLRDLLKGPGEYEFSIPKGGNLKQFIKSATSRNRENLSSYHTNSYDDSVHGVQRVKLTLK